MAKHALVFIHGMGDYTATWHEDAMAVLSTAFSEYSAFKGKAQLTDLVKPIPVVYSTLLSDLRTQWRSSVELVKTTLGKQLDSADSSEKERIEGEIDGVANKIGAGKDSFAWTHAMDVVLYRFFSLVRTATNVHVAKECLTRATTMEFNGWSVIAHSLGTAVAHNALHSLYNTVLIEGRPPLKPVQSRPKVLAMVANVSRVLQLPGLKVFGSKVCPGSALLDRACDTYLNVRHQWDPFTIPQPFLPDPDWPDVATFHSSQYQHIQPSHLLLKKYRDVHDLDHYLRNPRVHVPIFRGIFGGGIIDDDELKRACETFDSGVMKNNTNDLRDELDKLLPAGSDSWTKLLSLVFRLQEMGDAP